MAFGICDFSWTASADWGEKGHFVAFGKGFADLRKFVISGQHDAGCHREQLRECGGIVLKDSARGRARGEFEPVFRAAADVLQKAEKQNSDLHYVKAIKTN